MAAPAPPFRSRPRLKEVWIDETEPTPYRLSLVQADARYAYVALTRPVRVPDVRAASPGVLGTIAACRRSRWGHLLGRERKKRRGKTMQIDKGASIAVVVRKPWANLHGVKMFLRQHPDPQAEIRGVDESHILFAKVLDPDDARGVWIELAGDKQNADSAVGRVSLLVPWS